MAKHKSISLTPIVLDRDGISTTETLLATRLDYLINGAESIGYDLNGIAASQTPTGATAMTLNGALGTDFVSRRGAHVLITSDADDTGRTFTVLGTNSTGHIIREVITGPDNGLIVVGAVRFYTLTSVTPDAATAGAIQVGVNGYIDFTVAYVPQHVAAYSAGNDSGTTITVVGEDRYGNDLSEAITGANAGTAAGTKNFARVYRATIGTGSAGAVELGWDGLCETGWFVLNYRGQDFNVGLFATISGTGTYKLSFTGHDVFASGFVEDDASVYDSTTMVSKTTNQFDNITNPPVALRLAYTAYTSGTVTLRIVQGGGV